MNTSTGTFAAGTVLNGLFEVMAPLERCGNVCFYTAKHIGSQRTVTLKVLHSEPSPLDPNLILMLLNEARCLSRLSHANIIRLHDFQIAESGEAFLILEQIQGKNLAALIRENNGIPYQRALPVFAQLCEALQAAHNNGLILRRLSPASVFFSSRADSDFVKISDLAAAAELASPELSLPFPACPEESCYVSPEVLKGENVDLRSDIFSLGCLIYETLVGNAAFTVNQIKQALEEHTLLSLPRFAEIRPELDLPHELEKVVRLSLERDRRDRFDNMEDLKHALLFSSGNQSAANAELLFGELKSWCKDNNEK